MRTGERGELAWPVLTARGHSCSSRQGGGGRGDPGGGDDTLPPALLRVCWDLPFCVAYTADRQHGGLWKASATVPGRDVGDEPARAVLQRTGHAQRVGHAAEVGNEERAAPQEQGREVLHGGLR